MDHVNYNLDEVVEPACRIVASGTAPAIEVVPALPPDRDGLRRLAAYATAQGVSLSVDEAGAILLCGGVPRIASPEPFTWRRWLRWSPMLRLPVGAFPQAGIAR